MSHSNEKLLLKIVKAVFHALITVTLILVWYSCKIIGEALISISEFTLKVSKK